MLNFKKPEINSSDSVLILNTFFEFEIIRLMFFNIALFIIDKILID